MTIEEMQIEAHETAVASGFWDEEPCDYPKLTYYKLGKIALMHSELGEASEAIRKNDKDNLAEELADTIIRIGDFSAGYGIDLQSAIVRKMATNKTRPYKHGKLA